MLCTMLELLIFLLISIIVKDASSIKTNGHLCKKIYENLADKSESFIFSPSSLELTLYMLHKACRDRSSGAREITENGFKLKNHHKVDNYTGNLMKLIAKLSDRYSSVRVTAALAVDQDFKIDSKYLEQMKKFFGDQNLILVQDDFQKNGDSVVANINELVLTATDGKIRDLLARGSINGETPVLLLSTILLKSVWQKKFTEIDEKFYTFDNRTTEAEMVSQVSTVSYCDDDRAQIVGILTKHRNLTVYFVLPKSRAPEALAALWKGDAVKQCGTKTDEGFQDEDVEVSIPEFKIEYSTDLVDALNALNINAIFDPNTAQLNKAFKSEDGRAISVDQVPQKAVIEINRNGIEAAAATASIMTSRLGDDDDEVEAIKIFKANRPFSFYVAAQFDDHRDMNYLFAGQFTGN